MFIEHFLPYRILVRDEIEEQLSKRIDDEIQSKNSTIELSEEWAEKIKWYKAS